MGKLQIAGVDYNIIDTKGKMTVADSFVIRSNKIGTGNGEAKFYIGYDCKENRDFFGQTGFANKCFLLKKDLLQYLEDCETEYRQPEQLYRDKDKMSELFEQRIVKINALPNIIWFMIAEQAQIEEVRLYINSNDDGYKLIRELSLPNITYLSAIKLQTLVGEVAYYYRLFVDYFGEVQHPFVIEQEIARIEEKAISENEKAKIIKARQGQGKYRQALSYDFLFDRGFITFSNDKKIQISPWLSKMTCSRANENHFK